VKQKYILAGLVAVMAVSTDLYLPGIPGLVEDLGASDSQGQLTLSVFLIGFAFGQMVYGSISDQIGRKPALFIGLFIYSLGSLACTLALDINTLIAARFVQGLGGAAGPVVARAIVADSYDRLNAARMMAGIAGAMAVVPAVAPVLGSWLLYFFDWRAHFVTLLILGGVTLFGVHSLRETCATIGHHPLKFSTLVGQFPLCLRNWNFVGYTLCGGSAYAAMFCYMSSTSFIVIDLLGIAPEMFGYTALCVVFGYFFGARISSRKVVRWGSVKVLALGQLAGIAGAAILLILAAVEAYYLAPILCAFFLIFMSGGLCLSVSQMGAIAQIESAAGKASSVFGFLQLALASFLGLLVGLFYDDSLLSASVGVATAIMLSTGGYLMVKYGETQAASS
jgi:DHA1 family bicyclomycin/chloramphenicol resistance-like MFS transporter